VFVGAEYEDNLSIRTLVAAVRRAGLTASFLRFNSAAERDDVVARLASASPPFVGLSLAFQHRAAEFLEVGAARRRRGWRGHLCAGGHVATMMTEAVLAGPAVDTVLAHEAEETVVALLRALDDRAAWPAIPGLAWREGSVLIRNPPASACRNLDGLPRPVRDTPLRRNLGLGFAPLSGSRGCYGACRFCSIGSEHRARPGPRLRFRSPADVADEMAELSRVHGARIFCFHDETLFLRSERPTRERLDALAAALGERGVHGIAVVGKTRPDAVSIGLLQHLRERLGLMRLYVGIENWSARGAAHLGRGMDPAQAAAALEACRASGIYGCYNLLLFEPDAVLDDVAENVAGIERFLDVPVNFCRAEAYTGTALWADLRRAGRLREDGFAVDYDIADPRVQRLFEIVQPAFHDRNFAQDGLANLIMTLAYEKQLLRHFSPAPSPAALELTREVDALVRDVNADTAARLREAVDFARTVPLADRAAAAGFTIELATRVNTAGAELHGRLFELRRALVRAAAGIPATVPGPQS
jgi:anaerobic magnesium-protoporphyrin IX monomethyl ester cyclase